MKFLQNTHYFSCSFCNPFHTLPLRHFAFHKTLTPGDRPLPPRLRGFVWCQLCCRSPGTYACSRRQIFSRSSSPEAHACHHRRWVPDTDRPLRLPSSPLTARGHSTIWPPPTPCISSSTDYIEHRFIYIVVIFTRCHPQRPPTFLIYRTSNFAEKTELKKILAISTYVGR